MLPHHVRLRHISLSSAAVNNPGYTPNDITATEVEGQLAEFCAECGIRYAGNLNPMPPIQGIYMMICDRVIAAYLDSLGQKFACTAQKNGRLCIVTPYIYPDHDNIEVFVREKGDTVTVSDLGETFRRLDTLGMDVLDNANLAFTARRIAEGFGVTIHDGIILKKGPPEAVGHLVFEVISVCKAVGSLIYGSKAYRPVNFKDEVKQYLVSDHLQVESRVTETGRSRKRYKVSFRVFAGGSQAALVEPLSPQKGSGIKKKIDATFRMWYDIDLDKDKKVSLLNDELLQFKEEDIAVLRIRAKITYRKWPCPYAADSVIIASCTMRQPLKPLEASISNFWTTWTSAAGAAGQLLRPEPWAAAVLPPWRGPPAYPIAPSGRD